MATISKGKTFVSGETLTPTKLNDLVDKATISGIVNADISATAAIADSKLATISTPGKVSASAITSGNLSLSGNATITGLTTINGNLAVSGIVSGAIPAGAVMPFAMNSAPSGWVSADGSNVSRATFAKLFIAIGMSYGQGDGVSTFTLPDLRGYFVRGYGTNSDNSTSGNFGVKQQDELKSHTHLYTAPNTPGYYYNDQNDEVGVRALTLNTPTGATGGTETRPKNIAMLFCIKT